MIFIRRKKSVIKFLAHVLSLLMVFYTIGSPWLFASRLTRPILAQEVDEDAAGEAAEAAREVEEEARETAEDAAEEKQDFDEGLYEDFVEKNDDLPNWNPPSKDDFLNQYYGLVPTPTAQPTGSSSPDVQASPDDQPEGTSSETNENTNDTIFIDNNNHDTTLEQNIYTEANSGENVISQDSLPLDNSSSENPSTAGGSGGPALSCPPLSVEEDDFANGEENGEATSVGEDENQQVDVSGENQNVGNDSETRIETSNNDQTRVANKNCVEVQTDNQVIAETGHNEQLDNEGEAKMETGPGEAQGKTEVYGNVNQTEVGGSSTAEAKNVQTSDDSVNVSTASESETLLVENENQIAVQNNLSVTAESGENQLVNNEGEATLTTGPLDLMAALLNILNLNITGEDFEFLLVNIYGQFTGEVDLDDIAEDYLQMSEEELEAIAVNYQTGEDSENEAEAVKRERLEVENNNQAQVQNNLNVSGVSGRNELSENEDPINLLTGRIKIVAAILNLINTNLTGSDWLFAMINIFGTLEGDIVLPDPDQFLLTGGGVETANLETGDGSTSQAEATDTSNIVVTNDNQATVVNNVDVRGDSGRNQSLANEDETNLETQNVNLATDIIDWLDVNIFGNRFVLLIVNVMGRWLGNVIAFPGKGDLAPPEAGILIAAANGESNGPAVTAQNQQMGEDSTNTAVASSETTWEVDNQNVAAVENNIEVEAVSGQNETNLNEDPVAVTTGWIDINVDLLNIINLNVTGKEWLLVMVNIFGDFLGNVVFPHQESLANELSEAQNQNGQDDAVATADQGGQGNIEISGSNIGGPNSTGGDQPTGGQTAQTSRNQGQDVEDEPKENNETAVVENNKPVRKASKTLVLTSTEIVESDLEDEEALDISLEKYYDQLSNNEEQTYNTTNEANDQGTNGIVKLFYQAWQNLVLFLASLVTIF